MSAVLKEFAAVAGLGPKRRAIVVFDGAGWHTAKDLVVPEGVHLVKLPPYSPELQPAERLWPIITEGIANRTFATLPDLIKVVESRCHHMDTNREQVRALTKYHWWPAEHRCAV